MEEIIKNDPTFSVATFLTKVDNIFVMLCTSIMTENIDRVAHYISDKVYEEEKVRLQKLKDNNLIQMYDELNVKSTEIKEVQVNENEFVIKVKLVSRYMDYRLDKITRKLVSGNNTHRIEKTYMLTFVKSRDAVKLTPDRKCPKCGANMDLNNNGICKFCHSVFDMKEHDYILTNIEY